MDISTIASWALVGGSLFAAAEAFGTVMRSRPKTVAVVLRENWVRFCFGGLFGAIMAAIMSTSILSIGGPK
jgi:hypothetical protein